MDCYSSSSCRVNLDGNGLLIIDAQRSGGDRVDALLMERKRLSEETLRTEMLMQRGNSTGRIKARDTEAQTETETEAQRGEANTQRTFVRRKSREKHRSVWRKRGVQCPAES